MFKKFFNKIDRMHIILFLCLVIFAFVAAKPAGITHLTSLWIGDATDTATTTPGVNDLFVSGTAEIDGAFRADGGMTLTGTGDITGTNIADVVRVVNLPINSFLTLCTGGVYRPITAATPAPAFQTNDYMPSIVWTSGQTSPVAQTFRVPDDYSSGGAFRVFNTQESVSVTTMDFDVYINRDGISPDTTATNQAYVTRDSTSTSPDVTVLTVATDFIANEYTGVLTAGDWITFRLWRHTNIASAAAFEVEGAEFYYTASQ